MIVNDAQDIGALLRRGRLARGLTQQQLADAVGVSRQWVVGAEAGAPTAHLGLVLDALRHVDLLVDVSVEEPDPGLSSVLERMGQRRG